LGYICVTSARADQVIQENLEITQYLTLRQDAFMEGSLYLGKFASTQGAAFKIETTQEVSTVEREEVTPGRMEYQTVYVDDYDWLSRAVSYWVEEYGWMPGSITMTDWGGLLPTSIRRGLL